MNASSAIRTVYKVLRSFLFTAITVAVVLYVTLYVILSVPSVQNAIKGRAEKEVSAFLGSKVTVESLNIFPFNALRLRNVVIYTPAGEKCISVGTLGAGINLLKLIYNRKIEITYAEIIGLDGRVWKQTKDSALNIDFLIKAFAPKDKNKPPAKFDLKLYNVVIRRSRLSYDVRDIAPLSESVRFDKNHIILRDLRADVALPGIENDDFIIDLRRISFTEKSGFAVEKLALKTHITSQSLDVKDLSLRLPQTEIAVSDIHLEFDSLKNILASLEKGTHLLQIKSPQLTPSDFRAFYPALASLGLKYKFDADVSGNIGDLELEQFDLRGYGHEFRIQTEGKIKGLPEIKDMEVDLSRLELNSDANSIHSLLAVIPGITEQASGYIERIGGIDLHVSGKLSASQKRAEVKADALTGIGDLNVDCELRQEMSGKKAISGMFVSDGMDLGVLTANPKLGNIVFALGGNIEILNKNIDFVADANVGELFFNGQTIENISFSGEKSGDLINGFLAVDDNVINLDTDADIVLDGEQSKWRISADIRKLNPSAIGLLGKYPGYNLTAETSIDLTGNKIDNISGSVNLENFRFAKAGSDPLEIPSLSVTSEKVDSIKIYTVKSDFLEGELSGNFTFAGIAGILKNIAHASIPSLMSLTATANMTDTEESARINLVIHPDDQLTKFFALPLKPYTDVYISGNVSGKDQHANIYIDAPYIVKGESKMIRGTSISLGGSLADGLNAEFKSTMPAKNDDANITVALSSLADKANAKIGWTFEKNKTAKGEVKMKAVLSRNNITGKPDVALQVIPSSFRLNGSEWNIDRANIGYSGETVDVDNLRIWHAGQFVNISGKASNNAMDALAVRLAGIDLTYIFEALNINYVTFGGIATGEIQASQLFGGMPVLRTKKLYVKDLSYNGAVLGDGNLESHWVNDSKKVAINADIRRGRHRVALIGGGVYVTRDSLSFDMLADHVNIEFLKPFMAAFTSDVGGEASGRVKLYGTFKDIDLTGRVFADSISMKVDYTNVYYHGKDSVFITPGRIEIPDFRLYDKYGNSAVLKGVVRHMYFHEPEFEFKLSEARNLLCYDTNNKINPDWYGRIFASGGGSLRGRPGVVSMMLDVSTADNSDFTFVLSDTQTATDYEFLTFSDRKKKELEEITGTVDLEEKFRESLTVPESERPSLFSMDIRCSITPAARMNLIMDPKAGDKITARGSGPMQISYDTDTEEMQIYGKYTLDEGNYNFSLQDLILRDFKIYPGSNISFNGDPMQGVLDITAAYRVNTNLSDLDKSFATDRDLNRTNVPVDALLKVNGDMRHPEITFDIALPTLTQDVERKVKSIISTDEMMNRQIIYLLALNRFYTPEYMGSTNNGGGELASVASSTLSSQLSSFVGQLTDKVTLAPSFRSDKGDFSDMEVDFALSSRLLNNRLLINGNFGYRDRSTSQSTFVGDFDIEYLLNKNGGLRLKAYNHFNDQNYYLRSALTTQGIGVIYRKDFDNPFTFLKRKKKEKKEVDSENRDKGQNKNER